MASPKSQISPFKVGSRSVDPKHASDDGTFGKFINIFHMNLTGRDTILVPFTSW